MPKGKKLIDLYPEIKNDALIKHKKNEWVINKSSEDGQFYKAKILRTSIVNHDNGKKHAKYFLHYYNWNSSYDAWAFDYDVFTMTDDLLSKALNNKKGLKSSVVAKENASKKNKKGKPWKTTKSNAMDVDNVCTPKFGAVLEKVVLRVPHKIKEYIFDQYTYIEHNKTVYIKLPKPKGYTINDAIKEFIGDNYENFPETKHDKTTELLMKETKQYYIHVLNGIKMWFNQMICKSLLFKCEYDYSEIKNIQNNEIKTDYCDIFGMEHFMRIFLRLQELFDDAHARKDLTPKQAELISQKTSNFFAFIVKKLDYYCVELNNYANNDGLISQIQ